MTYLENFMKKIEEEHSSSPLLKEIEAFCKKNKWDIRKGKLPSISQLEHLKHIDSVAKIAHHIVDQSEKGTHKLWLTEVDYDGREKPFYRYLLDQIIKYSRVSQEKYFIRYFIDYVKLTKNE